MALEYKEVEYRIEVARIAIVSLLIILSWLRIWSPYFNFDIIAVIAVVFGGYPLFKDAYNLLRRKILGAEVFMSMGVLAAFAIGQFLSAAAIAFFMLIADLLEDFTVEGSRRAIRDMIEIKDETYWENVKDKVTAIHEKYDREDEIIVKKWGNCIRLNMAVRTGSKFTVAPNHKNTPIQQIIPFTKYLEKRLTSGQLMGKIGCFHHFLV